MISHSKISIFALAVATAMSAPAFAAADGKAGAGPHGGKHGMRLQRLDTDKNGSISKDEFLQQRTTQFKDLDTNKDGAIDDSELEAPMKERSGFTVKRLMKRLDANADGKVTREEFQAGPQERFKARDLDSDGKITEADLPPNRKSAGGWFGGGKSDGKMRLGGGRRGADSLEDVNTRTAAEFAKIDTNADGAVDIAELEKQAGERIAYSKKRMLHGSDTNSDGKLSQDEFTAKSAKRFVIMDLNSDGKIGSDDFAPRSRGWFSGK